MPQPESSVDVSPQARDVIHQHAIETYPHECCGALFGDAAGNRVIAAQPLPNTTEEGPRRRFLVRPADYLAAERGAKAAGLELIGFYHSHPDHPARPSQHDLDHAWPNFHYVIASVLQGRVDDVRTWFLRDDRSQFDERPLVTAS
jgi:proteasome lid subunit RPN8/RPN11